MDSYHHTYHVTLSFNSQNGVINYSPQGFLVLTLPDLMRISLHSQLLKQNFKQLIQCLNWDTTNLYRVAVEESLKSVEVTATQPEVSMVSIVMSKKESAEKVLINECLNNVSAVQVDDECIAENYLSEGPGKNDTILQTCKLKQQASHAIMQH